MTLRLGFELSVVHAEALDRCKDVIGGFCPPERLWIGVVLIDEGGDGRLQGDDATVNATSDLAFGQQSKEALHLINPRGTGRRQMHVPARAPIEPVSDQRSLAGCIIVIVDDQMYSRSAGTAASTSSRNLQNSMARWRG